MPVAPDAHIMVASMISKIEQGAIEESDLNELRKAVQENPQTIPYLDRSFLNGTADRPPPQGTVIVRYGGLVQNMLESEYYLSEVKGVKTHYRDVVLNMLEDGGMNVADKLAERQQLVVVPIPFASEWVAGALHQEALKNDVTAMDQVDDVSNNNKRERDEDAMPPTKRSAPSITPDSTMTDDTATTDPVEEPNEHAASKQADWWPEGCMNSNPAQCPVLAKMYYEQDPNDSPKLRLNEVVEMVGVLSIDPMDAEFDQGGDYNDFSDFEGMAVPPPSLLPRLHVLCYNRVNLEAINDVESTNSDYRKLAIQGLNKYIFGGQNEVAAEALLMTLMSLAERQQMGEENAWIPMKTPSDSTLGCASLNLILSSQQACEDMQSRLQSILGEILPICGSIQLDDLGKTLMSPIKDETARLEPSPLQLPKGAALIINESSLAEGRITARAQETLLALKSLTKNHSVPYRFEGNIGYSFEADYRVIVLSNGAESKLLPCSMTMNLSDIMLESPTVMPDDLCKRIRSYLSKCRSKQACEAFNVPLSKTLLELAQHDFIERRAEHRSKGKEKELEDEIGENVFHRWLTIARLQARSRIASQDASDAETWAETLRLDDAMRC